MKSRPKCGCIVGLRQQTVDTRTNVESSRSRRVSHCRIPSFCEMECNKDTRLRHHYTLATNLRQEQCHMSSCVRRGIQPHPSKSGIAPLIASLQQEGVNTWSVGFERNPFWQVVNASRIHTNSLCRTTHYFLEKELLHTIRTTQRIDNFVFYAGDRTPPCRRMGRMQSIHGTSIASMRPNMQVSIRT